MKRDMDLVREILFALEDAPFNGDPIELTIQDYPHDEVSYHVMLLHEAKLIYAIDETLGEGDISWQPVYLTWEGHEFLEAAKDDTRWNRAKTQLKQKGVPMIFDIFKSLLLTYANQTLFGKGDS